MRNLSHKPLALALLLTGALACSPVFADKPEWAGGGKPGKSAKVQKENARGNDDRRGERGDGRRGDDRRDDRDGPRAGYFDDRHRTAMHEYFTESYRSGRCPPGLAKKHNGCMPPGQAKKWRIGHPLPRNVIFYDLPPQVVVHLGPPPAGHRFVRVASDILLIAIGTGMVIDAIQDLSQ